MLGVCQHLESVTQNCRVEMLVEHCRIRWLSIEQLTEADHRFIADLHKLRLNVLHRKKDSQDQSIEL